MQSTFPDDENGDALQNMARAGDDLSKERDIDFFLIFYSQQSALEFCQKLSPMGSKMERHRNQDMDNVWTVTVTLQMLPTHHNIADFEEYLFELARPLKGENDGWGCFSVNLG